MRLGLGCLLVALVTLSGCSGDPKRSCSEPSSSAGSALEGSGPITGDGEVAGAAPTNQGGGGAASAAGASSGCEGSSGPSSGRASDAAMAPSESSGAAPSADSSGGAGNGSIQAGTLTAGAWDDNKNFERFLSFRTKTSQTQQGGLLPIDENEHRAAHDSFAPSAKQKLDVSLVIDTTGSMGDEIAYLQKEFDALAATIQGKFPGAEQRWSLVLYKDVTDSYVVRWFDFRSDTVEFRSKLAAQSAGGGGDFPEAADQGLDVGTRLSWRSDPSVAKVMFWVADAPHHAGTEARLASALRSARQQGIHIYPVASSGIDDFTELTMREAAQLTGGRYLFLTDDSGVGGAHKEADVPCFFVTKLDRSILRMVDIEMTGIYKEPEAGDVLRTGGDPKSGVCQLDDGQQVSIY